MSRLFAIYQRELGYFYNSIVAYVVIMIFVLLGGWFFYNLLAYFNMVSIQMMQNPLGAGQLSITQDVLQPLFGNLSIVMLLIMPLLTMRLLSEERRSGTAELLFTYPISDWDVVLGKYFATLTVFASMLAITMVYPLLLMRYVSPEWGAIFSAYFGLLLLWALGRCSFGPGHSRGPSRGLRCCARRWSAPGSAPGASRPHNLFLSRCTRDRNNPFYQRIFL